MHPLAGSSMMGAAQLGAAVRPERLTGQPL
jgi:hypothetical protein